MMKDPVDLHESVAKIVAEMESRHQELAARMEEMDHGSAFLAGVLYTFAQKLRSALLLRADARSTCHPWKNDGPDASNWVTPDAETSPKILVYHQGTGWHEAVFYGYAHFWFYSNTKSPVEDATWWRLMPADPPKEVA